MSAEEKVAEIEFPDAPWKQMDVSVRPGMVMMYCDGGFYDLTDDNVTKLIAALQDAQRKAKGHP